LLVEVSSNCIVLIWVRNDLSLFVEDTSNLDINESEDSVPIAIPAEGIPRRLSCQVYSFQKLNVVFRSPVIGGPPLSMPVAEVSVVDCRGIGSEIS